MRRTTIGAWLDRDAVAQPRDLRLLGPTITQVAWQIGHLALVARFGGVSLEIHIDILKTGIARGGWECGDHASVSNVHADLRLFGRSVPHELIG